MHPPLRIVKIFISPEHNFFGHSLQNVGHHPQVDIAAAEVVAGSGIKGDRYFNYKKNYKGQITFFDEEVYEDLCRKFAIFDKTFDVFRRNVITTGHDLNDLIGKHFSIQGIDFLGTEECRPCAWMNRVFAPGTEAALRGYGGLRARILTSGILRVT